MIIMSIENKDGFPEKYHLFPNPFKAIGRGLLELCSLHQLSTHGDHLFEHPLDEVLDKPVQEELWATD